MKPITWLRDQRVARGLTQADIATETGLTQEAISQIENRRITPKPHRWGDLALAYGVEALDVADFFETPRREPQRWEVVANMIAWLEASLLQSPCFDRSYTDGWDACAREVIARLKVARIEAGLDELVENTEA